MNGGIDGDAGNRHTEAGCDVCIAERGERHITPISARSCDVVLASPPIRSAHPLNAAVRDGTRLETVSAAAARRAPTTKGRAATARRVGAA